MMIRLLRRLLEPTRVAHAATIVHDDIRDSFLGNPTHSVPDMDTDTIASSLLDATDSGTITAAFEIGRAHV